MKIAILPGSFKPPHYGHYTLLKKMLEDKSIDKIYIIISNKPRYLLSNNKKSGEIDAYESEKIWKLYLSKLLKNNKNNKKVYIMISRLPSPIMMAYAIAKQQLKGKGDELILVKSSKDAENTRFDSFKDFKVKMDIWELPKFETMSSTNMRKTIYDKNKKTFMKFLPPTLSQKEKDDIWLMLKKKK